MAICTHDKLRARIPHNSYLYVGQIIIFVEIMVKNKICQTENIFSQTFYQNERFREFFRKFTLKTGYCYSPNQTHNTAQIFFYVSGKQDMIPNGSTFGHHNSSLKNSKNMSWL